MADGEWIAVGSKKTRRKPAAPPSSTRTFVTSGDTGFNHDYLRELLEANPWREVPLSDAARRTTRPAVDFVHAEIVRTTFDKRTYAVTCRLKNLFDEATTDVLTNKLRLHAALGAARYLPFSRPLADVERLTRPLILRPSGKGAYQGKGIRRVGTQAALDAARRAMPPTTTLASDYVLAPLLFDGGKKCHVRLYWLYRQATATRPAHSAVWRRGRIFTAATPYPTATAAAAAATDDDVDVDAAAAAASLDDAAIHDTHRASTRRNFFFPDDLAPQLGAAVCATLLSQAAAVGAALATLAATAAPFAEAEHAFEVFGLDFLIVADDDNDDDDDDDDRNYTVTDEGTKKRYKLLLMECNHRVGHRSVDGDEDARFELFARDYFRWLYDEAIAPHFAS